MRQSFEEFLRQKHKESNAPDDNPYNKWLLCLHPITWQIYAEQWSSQQQDDEVYEALAELEKCCLIAFDEDETYPDGSRYSSKSIDFMTAINNAKAILAKRKERHDEAN